FGVTDGELGVFVFDGGNGVPHLDVTEDLFLEKHPEVATDIVRTEDLSTLQPQFVNQTPPDLFQNSGAGSLDVTTLTANDQLAALDDLMAAPSWTIRRSRSRSRSTPGSVRPGRSTGSSSA